MIFSRANFITQEDIKGITLLESEGYLMRTINEICASGWTDRTLDLEYFRDLEGGKLNPTYYGALIVLDSFYSYNSASTLFTIRNLMKDRPEYADEMVYMNTICDRITSFVNDFVSYWHLSDRQRNIDFSKPEEVTGFLNSFVVPTDNLKDYLSFEEQILTESKDNPIAAMIALFPCYEFWPILFRKVNPDRVPNNIYKEWITSNTGGTTAKIVDTMFSKFWKEPPSGADAKKIQEIMETCIQFEYKMFKQSTESPLEK